MKERKRPRRRPYTPPKLTRVEVRLDEAVLVTCKAGGFFGPGGIGCSAGSPSCATDSS